MFSIISAGINHSKIEELLRWRKSRIQHREYLREQNLLTACSMVRNILPSASDILLLNGTANVVHMKSVLWQYQC
jgi:hypothetical protein